MIALVLAAVFASVGILFLLASADVLALFNRISASIGMRAGPEQTSGFYLALAVSYMYLVALIAFLMWRDPADRKLPLLLINAKAASALLSAGLFLLDEPLLLYGTNALVDGGIALGVFLLSRKGARAWS